LSENLFSPNSRASAAVQHLASHPLMQAAADKAMETLGADQLQNFRLHHLLREIPEELRGQIFAELPEEFLQVALYDWRGIWARDSQLVPRGDWFVWLILAGRGYGKMLDVDTPIPTPDGWARLGDLQVGDSLFDEAGRQCCITKTFDGIPEVAYRVTFSDGTAIDACSEHQWVTWTHAERKAFLRSPYEDATRFPPEWPAWKLKRKMGRQLSRSQVEEAIALHRKGISTRAIERRLGVSRASLAKHLAAGQYIEREPVTHDDAPGPMIRTTEEIAKSITHGNRSDVNHCIPVAGALQLEAKRLPINPYVLGVWLGNGSACDGTITAHQDDIPDLRREFEAAGITCTTRKDPQNFGTLGLHAKLRAAGVLNNKHVPLSYLRASIEQRTALLQGLLDTDGTASKGGHVEFSNTNPTLVRAVVELAHSLGQKPVTSEVRAMLNGVDHGPHWRVRWTPTIQVFRLPRKQARLSFFGSQSLRNHHRMIVSVERIESKPMRCLTVDSRHSMFLAGEAMVPTHNTRTGAESVRELVESGRASRIALIAPTSADARDTMVEGESGLLAVSPPWFKPKYEPSKRRVTWPNGVRATLFSAEEPERTRGPQHDLIWGDEPASWASKEVWDNAVMGLRLGKRPIAIITGTPKPVPMVLDLMKDSKTVVTRGSTFENSGNLAASYIEQVKRIYEGTRLGRQELHAEVLTDMPGALFNQALIDAARVQSAPELERIVIAVDPPLTSDSGSDECGIMAVGRGGPPQGSNVNGSHGYVLKDHSLRATPDEWARAVVKAFYEHRAECVVAEVNCGGDMVEAVLRSVAPDIPFRPVRAMRGKFKRAEPVAALYEQKKVHHVGHSENWSRLERQMRVFTGINGRRDDRTDALCWGLHELIVEAAFVGFL